jgi:hypothetical protein
MKIIYLRKKKEKIEVFSGGYKMFMSGGSSMGNGDDSDQIMHFEFH